MMLKKTIKASNGLVSDVCEKSMIGGISAKFIATGYGIVENNKKQKLSDILMIILMKSFIL